MKYRIKSFYIKPQAKKHGRMVAARQNKLPSVLLPTAKYRAERISLDALFEISSLPSPKRPSRLVILKNKLKVAAKGTKIIIAEFFSRVRKKFTSKKRHPPRLAFSFGVACASISCAVLSVCVVLVSLFGRFFLPYTLLQTPSVVGMDFSAIESELEKNYQILVSYEHSDSVSAGHIISQAPSAGVGRKIYKNRPLATLTLKVSMGKSFYTVDNLVGQDSRDALLSLYNSGVAVKCITEYSDSVSEGVIISTLPTAGTQLFSGEILTLTVSAGKQTQSASVPDLYGLGEVQALSILSERGFVSGKITYKPSSLPAGTVIEQSYAPYSSLPTGTEIDICVSLGAAQTKAVPDLYGLDRKSAAKKLAEVGLVLGGIYSVASGAPQGTVISQSPAVGTPITSSVTSVDIYISQ